MPVQFAMVSSWPDGRIVHSGGLLLIQEETGM